MNAKHRTDEPGREHPEPPPASGLEVLLDWQLAAATLVGQANARLFDYFMPSISGRQGAQSDSSVPWATANTVALELPTMQLRDFSTATDGPATLICAPYALHNATIADFAPGHSVVETLRHNGLSRVFVTDWRSATPEMRYFTIDSYLADLNVAVDQLGTPVNLIGLCQGGWLALVYATRFPEKVRRLVLAGAPIDIAAAQSQLSRFVAGVPHSMFEELVRLGEGIVDWKRPLKIWGLLDDSNKAEAVLQAPPNTDPVRRRELGDRYRQWYGETVRLPGSFYLQVVKCLFRENQIAEGRFNALGQIVDLRSVRVPIFLLAGGDDDAVPAGQLLATARLVSTPAELLVKMTKPCGHLSLFLSAVVLGEAWRNVAHWLEDDSNEPQIDRPAAIARAI